MKYGKSLNIGYAALLFILLLTPIFSSAGSIKDTESATHGTEASQHRVVDTYIFPEFKVIQFELPVLSVYSYLLISEGEALMIDPVRDISTYTNMSKKENVSIKGVYVSHSHADFIAGHVETAKAAGCPVYQSKKSGAEYSFKPIEDGSSLNIGNAIVRFIDTPGHTPDGMCGIVYSNAHPNKPELMFTGDVLFVGSVGRPDLMGGTVSAGWLASAMFDSWTQKISRIDDSVKIFPAHGAGSLCGAHLSDEPFSTVGREKASNLYFQNATRGAFVAALLEGLPEAPQYFKHNAQMNKEGPPLINWKAPLPSELKPGNILTEPSRYYAVDLRDAEDYASGHIPNSVNIGLRGRLETWVGTMVPWEAELVLVGSKDELKEALYRLHRVGYSAEILTMDSWKRAGLTLNQTPSIVPAKLYQKMQDGDAPVVVDVRLPNEWMALRIGTVLNMPLNELDRLCLQLDPNEPVVAVCNSAYRSSMAVGILERKGFKKATSLKGGSEAWIHASLPVMEPVKSGRTASAPQKRYVKLPERISADQLKRLMMDLPGTFDLVDIRPPEHFEDFNLPGSRNVDVGEILSDASFLIGPVPLIIVDRDGSIAMAVGGILSQSSDRLIKVLYGGLESYWSGESGAIRSGVPLTVPGSVPAVQGSEKTVKPDESKETTTPKKPLQTPEKKSAGC